jgi:diguanylate cyclase (GGDEF)-like protein
VADQTSQDRTVEPEPTNGSRNAQQATNSPASEPREDEQTLAGRDQTHADTDQTGSDSDQTASESDQAAADSDQAASDRDLAAGGDAAVHDATRDARDLSAQRRWHTADERVEAAAARDAVADDRDHAASARDEAAAHHDRELAAREAAGGLAAENRRRAAADRAAAAAGRARAAADRAQAALDREQAARDRAQAQADREALLRQLAIAETDMLTGARTRGPGLADLELELDRARRTSGLLVVAYIDVVGLKTVNDAQGHAAGDRLLRGAVAAIRGHLRSYDLIVRLGGDEFLCVLSGATLEDARERFGAVETALAADQCEIKVGFAELGPLDSADQLIRRADSQLPTNGRR